MNESFPSSYAVYIEPVYPVIGVMYSFRITPATIDREQVVSSLSPIKMYPSVVTVIFVYASIPLIPNVNGRLTTVSPFSPTDDNKEPYEDIGTKPEQTLGEAPSWLVGLETMVGLDETDCNGVTVGCSLGTRDIDLENDGLKVFVGIRDKDGSEEGVYCGQSQQ
mmetsp:Transcript_29527/g.45037  ORF Transcript_29527/g.45037 Transcript_29527/m.45037 type:complete len:164 (+) Transcript_29527:435-926(+)